MESLEYLQPSQRDLQLKKLCEKGHPIKNLPKQIQYALIAIAAGVAIVNSIPYIIASQILRVVKLPGNIRRRVKEQRLDPSDKDYSLCSACPTCYKGTKCQGKDTDNCAFCLQLRSLALKLKWSLSRMIDFNHKKTEPVLTSKIEKFKLEPVKEKYLELYKILEGKLSTIIYIVVYGIECLPCGKDYWFLYNSEWEFVPTHVAIFKFVTELWLRVIEEDEQISPAIVEILDRFAHCRLADITKQIAIGDERAFIQAIDQYRVSTFFF